MTDRSKTVCFSGHRIICEPISELEIRLETAVIGCIKDGALNFIAGGALGFDILVEQTVLRLKSIYPQITLTLALPCPPKEQTARWADKQRAVYSDILAKANEIIVISPHYINGCMHKRNRFMVDNSAKLICYLRQKSGGTYYTVNYAQNAKCEIVKL